MKLLIILFFSIFIFSGCEKASFETQGENIATSLDDNDAVELVHNDTDLPDNGDTGTGGDDDDDDEDMGYINRGHRRGGCSHDGYEGEDKKKRHVTVTPDDVVRNPSLGESCGKENGQRRVWVCHLPDDDPTKQHPKCLPVSALNGHLHDADKAGHHSDFLEYCEPGEHAGLGHANPGFGEYHNTDD